MTTPARARIEEDGSRVIFFDLRLPICTLAANRKALVPAREAGALGARLTGAGFGGCAIALVTEADMLVATVWHRFEEEGFEEPVFYKFHPSLGAEVAG